MLTEIVEVWGVVTLMVVGGLILYVLLGGSKRPGEPPQARGIRQPGEKQ